MPTKPEKPPKGSRRRKANKQGASGPSLNPDEVISEINNQSTALQKIVSRFLDSSANENISVKQKQKEK